MNTFTENQFFVTPSLSGKIYTVSQLNTKVCALLENNLQSLWITGEISNLSQPSSGHLYFSLKDNCAQVRCVFFRNYNRQVNFVPENGNYVLLQARASLYEPRGDFQLIVTKMIATGSGVLQIAFERLKKRLEKEGLFALESKKPIPAFPKTIGIITSPSGAAIQDILKVLKRRFPSISIIIYPTLVQGDKAAAQIVEAINKANTRKECDVLILARGGGPLEDLWPFNEEKVARAIFFCEIPIVSGIGHEIDFTIADFTADQRAATPSAAAEEVSPNRIEWLERIGTLEKRLSHLIRTKLCHSRLTLQPIIATLHRLNQWLEIHSQQVESLHHRLMMAMDYALNQRIQEITVKAKALETMNPLTTLERGYGLVTHHNQIVRKAMSLKVGDQISIQLSDGKIDAYVKRVYTEANFKKN